MVAAVPGAKRGREVERGKAVGDSAVGVAVGGEGGDVEGGGVVQRDGGREGVGEGGVWSRFRNCGCKRLMTWPSVELVGEAR